MTFYLDGKHYTLSVHNKLSVSLFYFSMEKKIIYKMMLSVVIMEKNIYKLIS